MEAWQVKWMFGVEETEARECISETSHSKHVGDSIWPKDMASLFFGFRDLRTFKKHTYIITNNNS